MAKQPIPVEGTCAAGHVVATTAAAGRVTWRGKCPHEGCPHLVIARRVAVADRGPRPEQRFEPSSGVPKIKWDDTPPAVIEPTKEPDAQPTDGPGGGSPGGEPPRVPILETDPLDDPTGGLEPEPPERRRRRRWRRSGDRGRGELYPGLY